jgi:membrane associated rhomboid family serine protease
MKNGFLTAPDFWTWFWQARLLIDLLVVMWVVAIVNFSVLPGALSAIGRLKPRQLTGLPGILLYSLLHGDWEHLLGNSVGYLIFGGMIVFRDANDFAIVTLSSAVVSGSILWLFGRPPAYVGSSGVIFGYIGFLVSLIYFYRDPTAIIFFVLIALSFCFGHLTVVPALSGKHTWDFGQSLWVLFPQVDQKIAWDAHVIGFVAGIWTASRLKDFHSFFQPIFQWFSNDLIRFIQ